MDDTILRWMLREIYRLSIALDEANARIAELEEKEESPAKA